MRSGGNDLETEERLRSKINPEVIGQPRGQKPTQQTGYFFQEVAEKMKGNVQITRALYKQGRHQAQYCQKITNREHVMMNTQLKSLS